MFYNGRYLSIGNLPGVVMLRQMLLYLSAASWAREIVTKWSLARRVARRFVAGETLTEAIEASKALNEKGVTVTLNYLGESVRTPEETKQVVEMYLALVEQIHTNGLQASVSIKPTHLGLELSEDLCLTNFRHILTKAKEYAIPITIDMESSAVLDVTLRLYRTLCHDYDFHNVGTVIQSYLRRSVEDMHALADEGAHIRLVKGAYLESPEIAFPEKADVDSRFVRLTFDYLQASSPAYLCVATHDENIIRQTQEFASHNNVPNDRYEFQMLYGIRMSRQLELAQAGYTVRAYVPFGEAWYPYFMRRLAERPANLWFFVRSFFSR